MSQPPKREGCRFCQRRGLPILPVRPAIMSQHDILPVMPESIQVPIPAQGETAYTLRLMRSGYLNIWDEFGKAWINYFVTEGGFYYPLPENGDVPDEIASGKIKPCIDQLEELAKASLVTLPVMPDGMKNGLFWFAWSEVKWTETIRKQFEDKSHREQYMQPFDMDAWLNTQSAAQALPLSQLEQTVADYSQHVKKSQMWKWSALIAQLDLLEGLKTLVYPITSKFRPIATGQQVETTARQDLHPNGALLVLQDPTGILKDLPTLIQYELDKNVYQRPDIKREVALYGAISSLKSGMRTDFERQYTETTQRNDRLARGGIRDYLHYRDQPVPETIYTPGRDSRMSSEADANWAKYQQYYDPEAVENFGAQFKLTLKEYNNRVVSPRTKLYVDWFQSPALMHYFQQHFDTDDLLSGIAYTSIVSYCIANMMDKKGSHDYFSRMLIRPLSDPLNIVGRGLIFNQDTLSAKIDDAVQHQKIETVQFKAFDVLQSLAVDKFTLPWAGLADAFSKVIEPQRVTSENVMVVFLGRLAALTMKAFDDLMSTPKVYAFAVAMGIFKNKEIIRVTAQAEFQHFAKNVSNTLIRLGDMNGSLNESEILRLVHSELKRLKVLGLPMQNSRLLKYCVDVDINELAQIRALPPKQIERALVKRLRLPSKTDMAHFADWTSFITTGRGKAGVVVSAGGLSVILQTLALFHSADLDDKKTLSDDQLEAHSRYYSGVVGIASSAIGMFDVSVQRFALLPRLQTLPAYKTLTTLGVRLGVGAGIVAVAFDIVHAIDESEKNNDGLAIAYLMSSIRGQFGYRKLLYVKAIF